MNPDQDAKVIVLIFELVTHCRHSTLFVTDTSLIGISNVIVGS